MYDASEITNKVKSKFDDFTDLHTRMDRDFSTWKLVTSDYDIKIDNKTKKHGSNINIISNDPRTNCDDIHSILSSSDRQISVRMAEEGEDKRSDIGKLERLFEFLLQKGDERLVRLLLPPLKESLIWFSLVRGWAAGRFLTYMKDGNIIPDYMSLDPRWLVYSVGAEGLAWTGYKTFRSKDELESDYEKVIKTPWHMPWETEKNIEVIDYWKRLGKGKVGNCVVSSGQFLKETEVYDMTSMPILIMPVTTRPPVAGVDGTNELEGYGESTFASYRDINGVRNRFLSMVASWANLKSNQPLLNYTTSKGREIPASAVFNVPGEVIELEMGEQKLEASPMQEIPSTVIGMLDFLNSRVERGMLPDVSMGSPPPSGTLYNLVQERGNKIFNPQLRNLDYFYADICRLIEEQIISDKLKIKVKTEEKRKYYEFQVTPIDLKKPHIIKVEHTARTPWTQLDTAQQAQMLKQLGLPDGWIWENILKVQDPKLLADLAAIELFEHSPKGAMKRAVEALIETRGDIAAAQSLVEDMDRLQTQEEAVVQPEGGMPPMGGM